MDGLNEPNEPRKMIAPEDWETFLHDFAARNKNRRARFDVFRHSGAVETEAREEHLADIVFANENNKKSVEIIRVDGNDDNAEKTRDIITNVRGIAVQYETDGSENALEITDDQDTLISLRLESKLDGNS